MRAARSRPWTLHALHVPKRVTIKLRPPAHLLLTVNVAGASMWYAWLKFRERYPRQQATRPPASRGRLD